MTQVITRFWVWEDGLENYFLPIWYSTIQTVTICQESKNGK